MPFDVNAARSAGYSQDEIADYLANHPDDSGFDVAGARKAGYSNQEIVAHLEGGLGYSAGTPIVAPIERGVAHTAEGVANTLDVLGAPSAGRLVHGLVNQDALQAPSSMGAVGSDLKSGNYLRALIGVPGAILEGAPAAVPAIAAGLLTGGAAPAIAAGATTGALTQTGDIAKARASAAGRSAPSASDVAVGLGAGTGLGALGGVGLGEAGPGFVAAGRQALIHGAADAGQAFGTQAAETAGTRQGITLDPSQAAAQALVGAGQRGIMSGAQRGIDQVSGAAQERHQQGLRDDYAALDDAGQQQQQNIVQAAGALKAVQDGAVDTGVDTRPQAAAREAARIKENSLMTLQKSLKDSGLLDPEDDTISAAVKAAKGQQGVLTQDHLDAIQGLGLDPAFSDALTNDVSQIAMLTDAGVAKRGTSVTGKAGSVLGGLAGLTGGAVVGHPFIGAKVGRPLGAAIGDRIGDALGITKPQLLKDAQRAQVMLDASGVAPIAAPSDTLANVGNDAIAAQQRILDQQAAADALTKQHTDALKMNGQFDAAQGRADAQAYLQQKSQALYENSLMDDRAAQQAAADRAESAEISRVRTAQNRALDIQEREGGRVAMMDYRKLKANADLDGAAPTVDAVRSAPQRSPDDLGTDPVSVAISRAAGVSPVPLQVSQGPVTAPLQVSQGPVTVPLPAPTRPPGIDPTNGSLPADAAAQAARLPAWKWRIGADLQDALHVSGAPRALNFDNEVNQSLDTIQQKGWMTPDMVTALKAHPGRVVPLIYNLIRNETLLRHGIDRTHQASQ